MANWAALAALFLALLAAPLVLGSQVVIQRSTPRFARVWFGGIAALLALSLVLGLAGLLIAAITMRTIDGL